MHAAHITACVPLGGDDSDERSAYDVSRDIAAIRAILIEGRRCPASYTRGVGLLRSNILYLMEAAREFSISGSLLMIGNLDIHVAFDDYFTLAAESGFLKLDENRLPLLAADHALQPFLRGQGFMSPKPELRARKFISGPAAFAALGFSPIHILDYSDYEGADIVFDLNSQPEDALWDGNQFDLVYESGTLEHVFSLPNALGNLCRAVKTGGYIMLDCPANNFVDHGFYQFSPTLFYDFFSANRFQILDFKFYAFSKDFDQPFEWLNYSPGILDQFSFGGLDARLYGLCFVARKTEDSTADVMPTQGYYSRSGGKWNVQKTGA